MTNRLILFLLLLQLLSVSGTTDYESLFNYYFDYRPQEAPGEHGDANNFYGPNYNADPFGASSPSEYLRDNVQFLGDFMKEKPEKQEKVEYVGETEKDKQKAIEVIKNNTDIQDEDLSDSKIVKDLYKIDAEKLVENTDGLFKGKDHLLSVVQQFKDSCKKNKKKQPTDWDGEYDSTTTAKAPRPARMDYMGLLNKYPNMASQYVTWKDLVTQPTHKATIKHPIRLTYGVPKFRLTYGVPQKDPTPPPQKYPTPLETYPTVPQNGAPTDEETETDDDSNNRGNGNGRNGNRGNGNRGRNNRRGNSLKLYHSIQLEHPRKTATTFSPRKSPEIDLPLPCVTKQDSTSKGIMCRIGENVLCTCVQSDCVVTSHWNKVYRCS